MSHDTQLTRATIPAPHPDNVEALADAINRFHTKLDPHLREDQDLTRIFAGNIVGRATVVVHYTTDGDA